MTPTPVDLKDERGPAPTASPASNAPASLPPASARIARTLRAAGRSAFNMLSSNGLTCLILLALMVLTYFGTVAQIDRGLIWAQKHYFDSLVCTLDLTWFGLPLAVPWPGALVLISLLAVNLVCGGILRIRWRRRTLGILITHFGILFLLVSGLVKFAASTNGFVQLNPGEQSSVYTSFHRWEIAIAELKGDGTVREHLIAQKAIESPGVHVSDVLPFRLVVDRFLPNCRPRRTRATHGARDVVDGFYLEDLPLVKQASANVPGAYVRIVEPGDNGATIERGLLWGLERHPWTVRVDNVPWTITLRRRIFDLPYAVRLERFRKEEHPGVSTPRHFSSDVTRIEDGVEQQFHIAMNQPMRSGGYMFSQNSWGPQDGSPGPYYTVLEVSSNPADQWPKVACYVIAVGLLLHFGRKLAHHLRSQARPERRPQ